MSDTKFEERKWELLDGYQVGVRVDYGDGFFTVASCQIYNRGKANAHLIAAAPDMYEMLERLKVVVDDYDYDLFCSRGAGEWSQPDASTEIDALLAKARGE